MFLLHPFFCLLRTFHRLGSESRIRFAGIPLQTLRAIRPRQLILHRRIHIFPKSKKTFSIRGITDIADYRIFHLIFYKLHAILANPYASGSNSRFSGSGPQAHQFLPHAVISNFHPADPFQNIRTFHRRNHQRNVHGQFRKGSGNLRFNEGNSCKVNSEKGDSQKDCGKQG